MAVYDIGPFKRGDNIRFDVAITLDGNPLDVSAYLIWCTGKLQISDADLVAVFQATKLGGQITVTGAGNNIARVNIPGAFTSVLTDNTTLFYDVQIKSPGGDIDTVASGRMQIVLDVTRAV